jgi:V8-like Glu-specific endopeptidase
MVPAKGRRPVCSAVLIERDIVLSAAHCFSGTNRDSLRVEFVTAFTPPAIMQSGDDAATAPFRRKLRRLVVHNGFSEDAAVGGNVAASNDLALFGFEGELPATHTPAVLNKSDDNLGETLELAGFGMTEDNAPQTTGILKTVAVPLLEKDAYRKVIVTQSTDADASGAMLGDSGGPAFVRRDSGLEVAGILSTGYSVAGRFAGKNTYTSVAQHRGWIEENLAKIRDPNVRVDPVEGLAGMVERESESLYRIIITNRMNEAHWCSFHLSAYAVYPSMEKRADMVLQPGREIPEGQTVSTTLSRNVSAAGDGSSGTTIFFAQRPTPGRPVRDVTMVTQCDDAPAAQAQKLVLSAELERELQE